ncbi:unnamed protein product [Spodoptera littoralis]|uniref:Integrin alpha second immunoglobulin-like domain-containing protein n=1 Tax=Spodoptera littoralis TaxID=7109 RepID=A0A9P0IE29_SPOLI|nr:unnamed protein product [Spodoptera littoralis]CAH1645884.1 unnamed protein product [Spodoptera littoralis]
MLKILTLVQVLHLAAATMFFHEPSSVIIKPEVKVRNTDFGFSFAFNSKFGGLLVGAPTEDNVGKLYNCNLNLAFNEREVNCSDYLIEVDEPEYENDRCPNQRFYLGASISAALDYAYTCAPMWTTNFTSSNEEIRDVFGTCFVYKSIGPTRYQGTLEKFLDKKITLTDTDAITGGTGWTTLADDINGLLLTVKTSLYGDILYTPLSKPTAETKSLAAVQRNRIFLSNRWNIGYAVTAGKFFSSVTMYAFSMESKNMEGEIAFLKYNSVRNSLYLLKYKNTILTLVNKAIGAMFGSALSAKDLNMDGLDELLVGAPALSDDECYECGALHIYLGGDQATINDRKRQRTILGTSSFGRFGSAIVGNDLDGDNKSEIVVSAPYENEGKGAIYILSGHEIYNVLMKVQDYKTIPLSELKLTQRIQKEEYRTLGFSLQFVEDVDVNGCKELVAGSPSSGTAIFFKCVQKVTVTLSSSLIGEQIVKEQDEKFVVNVCARVQLPEYPMYINAYITVSNTIVGQAATIPNPDFKLDITCTGCSRDELLCKNVTVLLQDKEPGDYKFLSHAEIRNDYLMRPNNSEFNSSWVLGGPNSKWDTSIDVPRHCNGDDCIPNLTMKLLWSGSENYTVGSSANESVTINVRNDGNASYDSCVWVKVSGVALNRGDCEDYNGGYKCYLDRPMRRETDCTIRLLLNMTTVTNIEKELQVIVKLYEICNQKLITTDNITIPYILNSSDISLSGYAHKMNITDKQIRDADTVYDDHEYVIQNRGFMTWKKVEMEIKMNKLEYLKYFNISTMDFGVCANEDDTLYIVHRCILDIMPNSTQVITGTAEINAGKLKNYLVNKKLMTNSTSTLYLDERLSPFGTLVNNEIPIVQEITLGSNKLLISLIALLVALILLAIITFILYKYGFFKRKQKKNLLIAKESVRRQSIKRSNHASAIDGPAEGLQMEVDEDSPFDNPQPVTTKDSIGLVEDKPK